MIPPRRAETLRQSDIIEIVFQGVARNEGSEEIFAEVGGLHSVVIEGAQECAEARV